MPQCPTCGRDLESGTNFCPACGTPLHSPAVAAMIQDALKALSRRPDDSSARYNLAIAYKLAGCDELAIEEFSKVAQLQPDFADAYYELGALQAKHGRLSEAKAALTRAHELDPENARIARLVARLGAGG